MMLSGNVCNILYALSQCVYSHFMVAFINDNASSPNPEFTICAVSLLLRLLAWPSSPCCNTVSLSYSK